MVYYFSQTHPPPSFVIREFADNVLPHVKSLGYNSLQIMAVSTVTCRVSPMDAITSVIVRVDDFYFYM
jgi:hypothetical protein